MEFDIGFLGGGQLARMSIQAAQRMGLTCMSIDPAPNSPASQIAFSVQGSLSDVDLLAEAISRCMVVTFENEFVPADALNQALEKARRDPYVIVPGVDALASIQDKLLQRNALIKAGVPSPKAVAIEDDGTTAVAKIKFPMVLKLRFGGYDGKGTRFAKDANEFEDHRIKWEEGGWLAEEFVPFKREVAVLVFRNQAGTGCFPTVVTEQVNHVCDVVFPADSDASQIAIAAVEAVGGTGIFGVELFELEDGTFKVNEIAPRPHNSGHYTLDWGSISQFDQHIRSVLGLPFAPLDGVPTCMANLLGQQGAGDWRRGLVAAIAADPGIRVHWYGKVESRTGRKMGHINAVGGDIIQRAKEARKAFYAAWTEGAPKDQEISGDW